MRFQFRMSVPGYEWTPQACMSLINQEPLIHGVRGRVVSVELVDSIADGYKQPLVTLDVPDGSPAAEAIDAVTVPLKLSWQADVRERTGTARRAGSATPTTPT